MFIFHPEFSCVPPLVVAVINAVNDYAYDASEKLLEALVASDQELDPAALRVVSRLLLEHVSFWEFLTLRNRVHSLKRALLGGEQTPNVCTG